VPPVPPTTQAHLTEAVQQIVGPGFTGVIQILRDQSEELTLLVANGDLVDLLRRNQDLKQHLPGEALPNLLELPYTGFLSSRATPMRCLLFERAIFDTQIPDLRPKFPNTELEALFAKLKERESATVVHVRWETAQGYLLIPGANFPARQAIFLNDTEIDSGESAIWGMLHWKEPICDLSLHQGALETPAWIEIHLGIVFEYLCSTMLAEYGYLTGRAMVNSIVRSLLLATQDLGYELTGLGTRLQVENIFSSTAEAVATYSKLLAHLEFQMGAMIGPSFVANVKRQAHYSLNPFYFNLVQYYNL
jgi:hypothetical protein